MHPRKGRAAALGLVLVAMLMPAVGRGATAEHEYLAIVGTPDSFHVLYPASSPDAVRQIAFSTINYTLKTSTTQLVSDVTAQLDLAEQTGYPVLLQFDDWNFPDPAWATDPTITEWTGWAPRGATHGPVLKNRLIEWAGVEAPSPNFESAKFRAILGPRLDAVFSTIAARVKRWHAEGLDRLFAGIVTGWESGWYVKPNAPGTPPATAIHACYAALTALGYTQAKIDAMAKVNGYPQAQIIDQIMEKVVEDYLGWWDARAVSAGISPDRIYTHYAPQDAVVPGWTKAGTLEEDGRQVSIANTVNRHSRPGQTMTAGFFSDPAGSAARYAAAGKTSWGAPEIEITQEVRTSDGTLAWLNSLSNAGAKVLAIWGWWEGPSSPYAVHGTPAQEGIARWLDGEGYVNRTPPDLPPAP